MSLRPSPKRVRRSSTEMYPLIESYLESDLGRESYCDQAGLPLPVFAYWYSKYQKSRGSSSVGGFVPLEVESSGRAELEVRLPNGCLLRFQGYPEAAYLRALLMER